MNGLADSLRSAAPAIAAALGGPLAGAAVAFLSSRLGVDAAAVQQAVAGMTPADLVRLKQLDLDFRKFMAENSIRLDLAQLDVNRQEAISTNWFVAGWRPATGWICGLALAYVALLEPLARFAAEVVFGYRGSFPVIDTSLTMQVLLGMLGLGAMRSAEKVRDAEDRR